MGDAVQDKTENAEQALAKLIESAGWGVFLIWFGTIFLAKLSWGIGLIGFGVILIGIQLIRAFFALKVHRFGLMLGLFFVVGGALRLLDIDPESFLVPTWLIPSLFIVAGMVVLVSSLRRSPGD
jgi:hypothetical protein